MKNHLGFDKGVSLKFDYNAENAGNILGKTAHYQPSERVIVLNITNRHPKDFLRSFAHELVHHAQNCRGDLDMSSPTNEGYAQKDDHLREMEREAYEVGNMLFRDWEDGIKNQGEKEMEEKRQKLEEAIRRVVVDALTKKVQKKKEAEVVEEKQEDKDVFQKLYENAIREKFGKFSEIMVDRYANLQKEGMKRLLGK